MSDRLEKLEAELASMELRPLAARVFDRIEGDLAREDARRPWADRMLICSMFSGAIAAYVIVATLLSQPSAPAPTMPQASQSVPRLGDYPLALARADGGLFDHVK
jgi:hypothetical protein